MQDLRRAAPFLASAAPPASRRSRPSSSQARWQPTALEMDEVDQHAGRQLEDQRRGGADAEREADIGLAPALLGQIDGEERAERRQYGRDEKVEPVEANLAAPRWSWTIEASRRLPAIMRKGRALSGPALMVVGGPARCQSRRWGQSPTARSSGSCGSHSSSYRSDVVLGHAARGEAAVERAGAPSPGRARPAARPRRSPSPRRAR